MIRWGKDIQVISELEAENESLKKEVHRQQELSNRFLDERDSARKELADSRECQRKTEAALSKQRAEAIKLTAKLREQTESDILLNALKAVGIIKEDKPEKPDYFDEHKRLLREHAHMTRLADYSRAQGDMSLARPFGGAFGGLR